MVHVGRKLRSRAKNMRKTKTTSENRLWSRIRHRRLGGYKFRRQYPIFRYILDFYCPQLKLAIEVDGQHHETAWMHEHDERRTFELEGLGIQLLRIPNVLLIRDALQVEEIIRSVIAQIEKRR